MKPRYFPKLGFLIAFTAAGILLAAPPAPAQAGEVEASEDVEVLTRGPVHEAFAEAVSFEAEAGFTVSSAPPELIEELPPEQQPEGENVTWIPGYWAWDDDQNDFLWISGVWRNIPPGRQWVPGYWNDLGDGSHQWISGYWADTATEEVEYVETAPPKSIDAGPNIAAPSEDHSWVPGNWIWSSSRYVWRPGYWLALRPNWTWVPSRYCWTPRGYLYVDGYWDYAVVNRGVLFAPVHFRRHLWTTPGYYYRPSIVVSLDVFSSHLFVRPRCRHYYFGDYYAPRYRDAGFYAGFHWHRHHHRGYDPIYAYQRWNHRHDNRWERRHQDNFNYFRDNDRFRPPHTWAAMRALRNEKFDDDRGRSRLFARSFDGFVKSPGRDMKFRTVDKDRRESIVAQRQQMRDFSKQRRQLEARRPAAGGEGKQAASREKLRRSPVVGRQASQFAKKEAPPARPEARGGMNRGKGIARRGGEPGRDAVAPTPRERGAGRNPAERAGRDQAPKPQTRRGQQRQAERQAQPKRESQARPQQRQAQPKREPQARPQQRQAQPKREPQARPQQRQAQPKRQQQARPQQRQAQPKRQQQARPQQRQAQPKRQQQARPQQRQAQPKRQQQARPQQRQAQPQRQQQARPQQRKNREKEGRDRK